MTIRRPRPPVPDPTTFRTAAGDVRAAAARLPEPHVHFRRETLSLDRGRALGPIGAWFGLARAQPQTLRVTALGTLHLPSGTRFDLTRTGTRLLAAHLGFRNPPLLAAWAQANPEAWGNDHGAFLLNNHAAYGVLPQDPDEPLALETVLTHWEAVAQRLQQP